MSGGRTAIIAVEIHKCDTGFVAYFSQALSVHIAEVHIGEETTVAGVEDLINSFALLMC